MAMISRNPATGESLRTFPTLPEHHLVQKIERAHRAFQVYRRISVDKRAQFLDNVAVILESGQETWARLMTTEMGKPLRAARAEVAKCARACRYYAENAATFLHEDPVEFGAEVTASVCYQPLGVVLAVMPWNFPFWQVIRCAAPALAAGNVLLLKHASNVPQCSLALEEIFRRAGLPENSFQSLLIGSQMVETVLVHPAVRAVTLTGSDAAGRAVASCAGRNIKKSVLELGGSDPFIVMPSADIPRAAATAVEARIINNGQSCIAAKRFIIHTQVAEEFTRLFVRGMESLRVGDPLLETTDVGPLATSAVLEDLEVQVQTTLSLGARLLTGGKRLRGSGFFYSPTILADVPPVSPAAREEIFGPVAALFTVSNSDEAISLANATPYGLGASVWTRDAGEVRRFAEDLEAGSVFFNGMVASDPRLPFGGVKDSGYGRELGRYGILEFVNIKTLWRATE